MVLLTIPLEIGNNTVTNILNKARRLENDCFSVKLGWSTVKNTPLPPDEAGKGMAVTLFPGI